MIKLYDMANNWEEIEFKRFNFSAGEVSVKIISPVSNKSKVLAFCTKPTSDDIVALAMLEDAVFRLAHFADFYVYLPYLPYSRQDRVCDRGEAFSLSVLANLLSNMFLDGIYTIDAHSSVSKRHISGLEDLKFTFWEECNANTYIETAECLIVPDKGAMGRADDFRFCLGDNSFPAILFDKDRDPTNGNILGISPKLGGYLIPEFNQFVIVDDICDGGRTFIELAKVIREKNPKAHITLVVAHGIFSKGLEVVLDHIDVVITTDSMEIKVPEKLEDKIVVLSSLELLKQYLGDNNAN